MDNKIKRKQTKKRRNHIKKSRKMLISMFCNLGPLCTCQKSYFNTVPESERYTGGGAAAGLYSYFLINIWLQAGEL